VGPCPAKSGQRENRPDFCHIPAASQIARRKKQIICPIYRGQAVNAPLPDGVRNKKFSFKCLGFLSFKE